MRWSGGEIEYDYTVKDRDYQRCSGTWLALAQPGHEVFERDRWWCTAPASSARRNLHRHHIVYRSHRGPDEPRNLTTLCAWHHQRGAHGTGLKVRGRAPDDLVFEIRVGRFRSGDRKIMD
jgi:hypothetical protein